MTSLRRSPDKASSPFAPLTFGEALRRGGPVLAGEREGRVSTMVAAYGDRPLRWIVRCYIPDVSVP